MNAYHEMSRRALLMDRFARNTAVMLVDRGAQHPPEERYQILFQPIDMDGVGHWIGAKPDGTPKFNAFNEDFARATGDLMVKLARASASSRALTVETAGGARKPLYEGGPLTLDTLYGNYLSEQATRGQNLPLEMPQARKAVVDYVLRPHDGMPVGLGFDTTKPDKPKVGSIIESGGSPRAIERRDGRTPMDARGMGRAYEAASGNQPEFAERHARRLVGMAELKLDNKPMKGNELELRLAERLAANPEFARADAAGRVRIAQEELAKLTRPPAPVPPPLPGAPARKAPAKPPPLPKAKGEKKAPSAPKAAPGKEESIVVEISEGNILKTPPPEPPPLPKSSAEKAPSKAAPAREETPIPEVSEADIIKPPPLKPPPLPKAAQGPRPSTSASEAGMRAQAKTYAGMAEASKPLPSEWADAAMVGMVRQAMSARKGEAPETVALDVVRAVSALADAATPGKAPVDNRAAKALGYRNAEEANASIALAREWAGIQGTPDRDTLMTASLAVRSMESQGARMSYADTTGQNYAADPGAMPPHIGIKMRWGEVEFTVNVFGDRVVMESVSPEHLIGQKVWPSEKAKLAALRYMQSRFRGALDSAFGPVMKKIPGPGADAPAWSPVFDAAKKVTLDISKTPPPLPREAMTREGIIAAVRSDDAASHAEAAAAFRAMPAEERVKVIRGITELARPAERRVAELISKAGEMEIRAGRLEREGKTAEAQAARTQAKTLRESADYSRKFAAHWYERAGYFNELNTLTGQTGDHLAARYGVKRGELEAAYAASPNSATARRSVFDLLGIKLDALPDASIRQEIYKGFTTLADDPYLGGMVFTGNLFGELDALIPGGKVKSIKFQNGLVGAYQLTVEAPGGKRMLLFAKRQDLNPDRTGSAGSRLLGAPAPDIMVARGNKDGGAPLRFTGPDGTETGYGIMRNMSDFAGTLLIAGREVKVKTQAADSFFDVALPTDKPERKTARDTLMRDVQERPESVMDEAGYFHTGAALAGFYDRHESNSWTTRVAIDEPPAKARETAEFLRKQGMDVRQEADGTYTFMRAGGIDTDTFGSYQGMVGSWTKLDGSTTPAQAREFVEKGYIIRQEADGSYSWFQAGTGNDVTFQPMFKKYVEDLHRFFTRFTYVMNEAEMRNAKAEGRPPKLQTVEQVVKRAFGENMDGPFMKGMRRRLREVDQSTPQGKEFARRMLNEVMKPFDGKPSGMGSPLSGRLGHDFESNGIAWVGGAFNGEMNTPITNRDGRATFRVRYEMSTNPTVSEAAGKRMVAALPENREVMLVPLDSLPAAARKQAIAAVRASEAGAAEFKTSMVRGKTYLVVEDAAHIPESIGGVPLRANSISVIRVGDTVYSFNQAALSEALPQGARRYVLPAEGLGMLKIGKMVRSGGKMLELGVEGKNRFIVFESLESVPAALRGRAVEVTRDQSVLRGDSGMGKKLGINVSELGAGRMLEEILKMGEDEWKGLWQIVRDGIVQEEGKQRAPIFEPEPGKSREPSADFLFGRVPINPYDAAERKLLPPEYGGPQQPSAAKPASPPPPPPSKTPILNPEELVPRAPPPAAAARGPGGTRIIGPAPEKLPPLPEAAQGSPAKPPSPPPPSKTPILNPEELVPRAPPPAAAARGPGGTKVMGPAEPKRPPPMPEAAKGSATDVMPPEQAAPAAPKSAPGGTKGMPAAPAKLPSSPEAARGGTAPLKAEPSPAPAQQQAEALKMPSPAPSDSMAVPAPKAVDEAARAKLREQNRVAQALAENPAELLNLVQRVARGEAGALDALGDHPAAKAIRDFMDRRTVQSAARLNTKQQWESVAKRDLPILSRNIRDAAVNTLREFQPAPKAAAPPRVRPETQRLSPAEIAVVEADIAIAVKTGQPHGRIAAIKTHKEGKVYEVTITTAEGPMRMIYSTESFRQQEIGIAMYRAAGEGERAPGYIPLGEGRALQQFMGEKKFRDVMATASPAERAELLRLVARQGFIDYALGVPDCHGENYMVTKTEGGWKLYRIDLENSGLGWYGGLGRHRLNYFHKFARNITEGLDIHAYSPGEIKAFMAGVREGMNAVRGMNPQRIAESTAAFEGTPLKGEGSAFTRQMRDATGARIRGIQSDPENAYRLFESAMFGAVRDVLETGFRSPGFNIDTHPFAQEWFGVLRESIPNADLGSLMAWLKDTNGVREAMGGRGSALVSDARTQIEQMIAERLSRPLSEADKASLRWIAGATEMESARGLAEWSRALAGSSERLSGETRTLVKAAESEVNKRLVEAIEKNEMPSMKDDRRAAWREELHRIGSLESGETGAKARALAETLTGQMLKTIEAKYAKASPDQLETMREEVRQIAGTSSGERLETARKLEQGITDRLLEGAGKRALKKAEKAKDTGEETAIMQREMKGASAGALAALRDSLAGSKHADAFKNEISLIDKELAARAKKPE